MWDYDFSRLNLKSKIEEIEEIEEIDEIEEIEEIEEGAFAPFSILNSSKNSSKTFNKYFSA